MNSSPFQLPGYSDVHLIGEGGLGRVYCAVRVSTGGLVALKELQNVESASPAWHRARRELDAMLRLKGHPYVVSVEEIVEGATGPCLVMEFLPGGSLHDRVVHGRLPAAEVVVIGQHVSQALAAAHAAGIVHRDVKPHNLLVGAFGQVKVCDFGIASVARGSEGRTFTQALTLAYASPEELDGDGLVGPAADVYSFGATMAHLLSGRKPSFQERLAGVPLIVDDATVEPPMRGVVAALTRCVAHAAGDRPSMSEMVAVFDAAAVQLGDRRLTGLGDLDATVQRRSLAPLPVAGPRAVELRDATLFNATVARASADVGGPPPPPTPPPPLTPALSPTDSVGPPPRLSSALIGGVIGAVAVAAAVIAVLAVSGSGGDEAPNQAAVTIDSAAVTAAAQSSVTATGVVPPTTVVVSAASTEPPTTVLPAPVTVVTVALPAATAQSTVIVRGATLNCNLCRLRSDPSITSDANIQSELVGRKGAALEVLEEQSSGWTKVRVDGQMGWLFGTFVWPVPAGFVLGEQADAIQLLDAAGNPTGAENPTGNKVLIYDSSSNPFPVLLPDGSTAYVSSSTPRS